MITQYLLGAELRQALEDDNVQALRNILGRMNRFNLGEAWTPGLKEDCNRARLRLQQEDRPK